MDNFELVKGLAVGAASMLGAVYAVGVGVALLALIATVRS